MARPFRAWRALLLGILTQILLPAGWARAAERQTVRAVLAGEPAVVQRVLSVLRLSLDHQGLALIATRVPRIDPLDAVTNVPELAPHLPVAYLWLDLTAKPVTLILVEAKSRLIYAQHLRVHAVPDEVETELIRYVIDQSLEAILSGNAAGVTPKEFRKSLGPHGAAPAPAASEPKPTSSRTESSAVALARWAVAAGYSVDALGANALLHGPEVGVQVQLRHLQVQLRLAQRLPLESKHGAANLRLVSSAARLVAASRFTLRGGFAVSLGLGAGLDVTRVAPALDGAVPAFWVSDPLLLSQLALEQSFGSLLLSGYAGLDWDVLASRYTVTRSHGVDTVWSPSRVRPCAGVSVGYSF